MAKLWSSLSILLVLAMLLFLAPAVILAPQNVAAAGEEVVQEVEATFTFSEDAPGDWWPFLAGNATIQPPGLCLEQYTRPYVLLESSLAGCGFRNYTAGSGTASGDLSGSVSLAWNTFRFNQQYTGDLYLLGATDFGWMAGRGHYYATNPDDNFTFGFVLDVDCDNDMTNAVGKGFMVSVEENGIFGDMANPVQDRHKIIGDFEVVKTGSDYTWTLHLRNYAPNEVEYKGDVIVEGAVMQENTDPIRKGLDLVNFTQDGAEATPIDLATGLEEIGWGKDPFKTVTAGPLGINGLMDITRNGALYLALPSGEVHIQAAEVCTLHIDDTDTGVRQGDGSTYGHAYYHLLLTLPYQELPLGQFFNQTGYTFYPFGMYLSPTDCYAGAESFAEANIKIESSAGEAIQTSIDKSYGLYPHPRVTSVVPNSGAPGETNKMVTISGKYFLRAEDYVANSGSVSFGPNITVNNYTVDSANQITANITIAAGASAGAQDVNVTSCFGYSSGSGVAPYKSGHGVFNVSAGGTTLKGQVDLSTALGAAPRDTWVQSFVVKGFAPGTLNANWTKNVTTDQYGVFTVPVDAGTYDIGIKNCTCLSELETGVTLTEGELTQVTFDLIRQGDCDENDMATAGDRGLLYDGWNSANIYQSGHLCDLNRDGGITAADRGLLYDQWNTGGAAYGGF